jgi:hypothetical protein
MTQTSIYKDLEVKPVSQSGVEVKRGRRKTPSLK